MASRWDPVRAAWACVVAVLAVWTLAAVAAWAGWAPSAGVPDDATPLGPFGDLPEDARQVVLVGVPGLTWDHLDPVDHPALARLAADGGSAALLLRGTHEVTCEADAWLTLGAGQRAATDLTGCGDADGVLDGGSAPGLADAVQGDAVDPEAWTAWQELAADRALGPRLGSLARLADQGGTCVAAYGDPAVLGAAGPDGTAAVATPRSDVDGLLGPWPAVVEGVAASAADSRDESSCRIHLLAAAALPGTAEPGTLGSADPASATGGTAGDTAYVLAALDAELGELAAALPPEVVLLVAGMGQTGGRAQAQVLVGAPAQERGGLSLRSGSTQQRDLVQLTDLTPTLLAAAGVAYPEPGTAAVTVQADLADPTPLAGQPVVAAAVNGDQLTLARGLGLGVSAAKVHAPWILGALAALVLPVLLLGLALQHLAGRRHNRAESWRRRGRLMATGAATTAMAVPVATFMAGWLPWWRVGATAAAGTVLILLLALAVAGLAWLAPWRRHPLGPAAFVATVTLVVTGVDVIWSARLALVSVMGLQPVTAGRFYGQGNVGFGLALGALLVLLGAVLTWLRRPDGGDASAEDPGSVTPRSSGAASTSDGSSRGATTPVAWPAVAAVLLLGAASLALNAAPQAGADFGGVPATVMATGLLVLHATGRRWRTWRVLVLLVAAALVGALIMTLDWLRGAGARTHLGDFVQAALDGEALGVVTRKLDQNLAILLGYPIAWVAVAAIALFAVLVARPPRWAEPLVRHPALRPVGLAAVVALLLTWVLNDSGLPAAALVVAMLTTASFTILGRGMPSR